MGATGPADAGKVARVVRRHHPRDQRQSLIVLDASVVLELISRSDVGNALRPRLEAPGEEWHAPHVMDVEVGQALRRYTFTGTMTASRADAALSDLRALPILRHVHGYLIPRAWELRHNLSVYDGVYVALAEHLKCAVLTMDRRLAGAPGLRVNVEIASTAG